MSAQKNPILKPVSRLLAATKKVKPLVKKLQNLATNVGYEESGTKKEFEALVRATKIANTAIGSLATCADSVLSVSNAAFISRLHKQSVEISRSSDSAGITEIGDAVAEAMADIADIVEHSRERLLGLLLETLGSNPALTAETRPRFDEWVKGVVSDQIPWSATIQNVIKHVFEVDIERLVWEPLAEDARRNLGLRLHNAINTELELTMQFSKEALEMARLVQTLSSSNASN